MSLIGFLHTKVCLLRVPPRDEHGHGCTSSRTNALETSRVGTLIRQASISNWQKGCL
nr:MAG TPA: hypothetical protein [Caudoviricetes sp.]